MSVRSLRGAGGLLLLLHLALVVASAACGQKSERSSQSSVADEEESTPKKTRTKTSSSAHPSESAAPRSTGESAPTPAGGMTMSIDGSAPVELKHAFIKQKGAGSLQLYATTGSASCQELIDNLFDHPKDEKHILLDLKVGPEGTSISDVYTGARSGSLAPGSKVSLTGDGSAGGRNSITLDYVLTENDKEMLRVKGSFVAEGCGARP